MGRPYISTSDRRKAIIHAYGDDEKWAIRVKNMPNIQVYAIFDELVKSDRIVVDGNGKLSYRTLKEVNELRKRRKEAKCGHQITLDEWMMSRMEENNNELKQDN